MTVDTHPIGNLVAEVMEEIESTYGESASLGIFAIVAEINIDEEDGPGVTHVTYRCNDNRTWIQAGLFEAAKYAAMNSAPLNEDDEE
jgi:hypothetical protein